jgi:hypothetical protein
VYLEPGLVYFHVNWMVLGQVIITPKAGKGSGMVAKAKELAEKHGWFPGRFEIDTRRWYCTWYKPRFLGCCPGLYYIGYVTCILF